MPSALINHTMQSLPVIIHFMSLVLLILRCGHSNVLAGVLRPEERTCSHSANLLHDDVFYNVHIGPEHEIKKRSADQPLRIHLYFDDSLKQLPTEHQNIVQVNVEMAVKFWESTLKVRATNIPIHLRRKCRTSQVKFRNHTTYCMHGCMEKTVCGDITIPEEHLEGCLYYNVLTEEYVNDATMNPGVSNTDFILYIATIASKKCKEGQTVAYAAHCQQEQALDRPVAGYFSICPSSISSSRQSQQQLLSTMKHEILHALGFTASLYAFYRDDEGHPLTPRNPLSGRPVEYMENIGMHKWSTAVVKRVMRTNWLEKSGVTEKPIFMMVTPRVKAEVQKHFNCSTLEGAELEDQGIDGTVFTHWEKRVFENEAMTGTYTQNSVISRITLAMMEDTGWYKADYSKAGDYDWGRGFGCDFVQNSCYHWMITRMARKESIYPFCDQVKRGELWTECAHQGKSVALCNLVEYSHFLPANYQYFDSLQGVSRDAVGRYGGSVVLADYCPYLQEFSWTNENNLPYRGSNCLDAENNLGLDNNVFGEKYGEHSLCFKHASKWNQRNCYSTQIPQHAGSGCYEYSCVEGIGLIIHIQNQSYRCFRERQVISVIFNSARFLHQGTVVCPNCNHICKNKGITCPPDEEPPSNTPAPQRYSVYCRSCKVASQPVLIVCLMCFLTYVIYSVSSVFYSV